MSWLEFGILVYGFGGFCAGFLFSNDIVRLLNRARHRYGPPGDWLCIVGAGMGVFLLVMLLWLPLVICNSSSKGENCFRLNEHRVR